MRFADGRLLWMLLVAPVAVLAYAFYFRTRRRLLARLGQVEMIRRMTAGVSVRRKVLRAALAVTALTLMALALVVFAGVVRAPVFVDEAENVLNACLTSPSAP